MILLEKWEILTPLQKLPNKERDLGKLIVAKGFKKLPKVKRLPNLVTLLFSDRKWRFVSGQAFSYYETPKRMRQFMKDIKQISLIQYFILFK